MNEIKPFYRPMMLLRSKFNPLYYLKGKHKVVWVTSIEELIPMNTDRLFFKTKK